MGGGKDLETEKFLWTEKRFFAMLFATNCPMKTFPRGNDG